MEFCKTVSNVAVSKDKLYSMPVDGVEGKVGVEFSIIGRKSDLQFRVYKDRILIYYAVSNVEDISSSFCLDIVDTGKIRFVVNQDAVITFKIYNL